MLGSERSGGGESAEVLDPDECTVAGVDSVAELWKPLYTLGA
jgi:hypothetical protein